MPRKLPFCCSFLEGAFPWGWPDLQGAGIMAGMVFIVEPKTTSTHTLLAQNEAKLRSG